MLPQRINSNGRVHSSVLTFLNNPLHHCQGPYFVTLKKDFPAVLGEAGES